ncbi:3-phenylpropionate/cinnamic acid dioxygenase subunit beta [Acinetobacter wuhouensis]|uniref:3-phenylpropionate/cinnamic acid dioxygenase subunit beta n=1 Tax=Acinetobacter wuhouensis TaxID=1879050 RepID=A0A385C1I2_9GAMM|nr:MULTISPECIES: 3-phenylpropionate/cinnamic acid dioxygenase subunit beta [Acinetobacter]AXQ21076.1 3-phenylpropionate/cinnamic acid dioxygenase subunit beta [Acinetobacter wuhouensis]RZG49047.1 3-phenylpropionate/cinnamic acid dioxygenase subunit beta [Acinetobacter wuhouensis]RZG73531.1 3-phenylpropionate/cinnamic acid dioxygenase subunit beta [Acinetobacter wuhouensis]RZG78082.1 3-phenylpropionate/cinnamic acid dioxygenase subunit beta [Acinetobacter sp. WCHAc060025]RZG92508.1 3-phenylprop
MSLVSLELQHQISQFLYREAKLLDDWKFREWLDVFAEDISYTLRTTPNAQTRDRRRSVEPPTTWVFNDNKHLLERRVARLETGMAWAEEPPSRTTHMVSNVIVEATEVDGEYDVYVTYLLYRTQKEKDVTIYCGKRHDKLRQVEGGLGWQIFNRKITLDQVTYNSHNLSVFF